MRSSAQSQLFSSHFLPPGARYRTFWRRRGLLTTWMPDAPLLQSVPSLTGCLGSPSMLMTRPSRVETTCPQPTPQKGQTVVVSVAPLVLIVGAADVQPVSDNAPMAAAPVVTPL